MAKIGGKVFWAKSQGKYIERPAQLAAKTTGEERADSETAQQRRSYSQQLR